MAVIHVDGCHFNLFGRILLFKLGIRNPRIVEYLENIRLLTIRNPWKIFHCIFPVEIDYPWEVRASMRAMTSECHQHNSFVSTTKQKTWNKTIAFLMIYFFFQSGRQRSLFPPVSSKVIDKDVWTKLVTN